MINTIYYYVSIKYYGSINDSYELKELLFEMTIIKRDQEYIYDVEIDEVSTCVLLEITKEGYEYIMKKSHDTFDVELKKVVFYLTAGYKYNRF